MRRFTAVEYVRACAAAALVAPAILARPYVSRERWRRYQEQRIARLLRHAWERTTFYRRKYEASGVSPADFRRLEDLERFPAVTKAELVDAMHRRELGASRRGIDSVSSGSSGRVITVTHRVSDTHAYAAGRFRILNMTRQLRPWTRTMNIYTSAFPANSFFGLYRSWFIPTLTDLDDTIARLRNVRPQVLCVYPSRLLEIAARLDRRDARALGLRFISVNSELSSRTQRDAMADHFGCPVLEEYSTEELGWVAAECSEGAMHLWEDMAYVETLSGEIVGTNLHNLATPFIRYRQGDSASLQESHCACGRTFRTLRDLVGRCNDAFHFSGGTASSAVLLDGVYSLLLDDRLPIADFCLVQDERDSVRFQYSLTASVTPTPSLDARIIDRLTSLLPGGVAVHPELTAHMHKTVSGKRNPIVSLVARKEREPALTALAAAE